TVEEKPAHGIQSLARVYPGIHGAAVDEHDVIYIADTFGTFHPDRPVYALKPPYTGQFVTLPVKAAQPSGLTFVGNHLFVCDTALNRVTEYDDTFKPIRSWNADAPWMVQSIGAILYSISAGGAVEVLDPAGHTSVQFEGL